MVGVFPCAMDEYLDSWCCSREYDRPSSIVVADGAHVIDTARGRNVDVAKLAAAIASGEDNSPYAATGDDADNQGWFWVDSREKEDSLRAAGVDKHFTLVLFENTLGRQSGRVDAKIQSLLRRATLRARQGTARKFTFVLLASDGDHAPHLKAASDTLRHRRIEPRVFVYAWRSDLSQSLRRVSSPRSVFDIAAVGSAGASGGTVSLCRTEATLKDFVDAVLPCYDKGASQPVHMLLRSDGLHKLLRATWSTLCGAEETQVLVVCGRTGSGKTTQIPQLLLDQIWYRRSLTEAGLAYRRPPRIICVQPRRLACEEISARVVEERLRKAWALPWLQAAPGCEPPGKDEVGYTIGGVKLQNETASLVFLTPGVFLQRGSQQSLGEWDAVIIDEIHDRSVQYDLLLRLLLDTRLLTPGKMVFLMSATLDGMVHGLCGYARRMLPMYKDPRCVQTFDVCEQLGAGETAVAAFSSYPQDYAEERHPVDIKYLDDSAFLFGKSAPALAADWNIDPFDLHRNKYRDVLSPGLEDFAYRMLVQLLYEAQEPITILAFFPSITMMNTCRLTVKDWWYAYHPDTIPEVYFLHSQVAKGDAFTSRRSKLLLATDTAESSVTIPNVAYVVDLCLQKESRYVNGYKELTFVDASKAACRQRAGRTGRTARGTVLRMVMEQYYNAFPEFKDPEMVRCNLESEMLMLHCWKAAGDGGLPLLDSPAHVIDSCITPPKGGVTGEAQQRLVKLGLLNMDAAPTDLGELVRGLPFDPDLGRFVVWCCLVDHKLGRLATEVAAMLNRDVNVAPESNGWPVMLAALLKARSQLEWAKGFPSDVIVLLELLRVYRRLVAEKQGGHEAWCAERGVNAGEMRHVDATIGRARQELHKWHPFMPALPEEALGASQEKGLVAALRAEPGMDVTDTDRTLLVLLHCMAFAGSSEQLEKGPKAPSAERMNLKFSHQRQLARMLKFLQHRDGQWWLRLLPLTMLQSARYAKQIDISPQDFLAEKVFGAAEGVYLMAKIRRKIDVSVGAPGARIFPPCPGPSNHVLLELRYTMLSDSVCDPVYQPEGAGSAHMFWTFSATHVGRRPRSDGSPSLTHVRRAASYVGSEGKVLAEHIRDVFAGVRSAPRAGGELLAYNRLRRVRECLMAERFSEPGTKLKQTVLDWAASALGVGTSQVKQGNGEPVARKLKASFRG